MNLNEMKKKTPTTGWFTFDKSGVEIELRYESPAETRMRAERCTEIVNGRERANNEKAMEEFAGLIISWRGLTLGKASELMNLELPADADLTAGVPCTKENKLALIVEAWGFENWVGQKCTSLADFVAAKREAERKNSQPSPSGGSPAA